VDLPSGRASQQHLLDEVAQQQACSSS